MALSTDIKALDQEVLSLPMRLDLLRAERDEEAANVDRFGKRVEALKALKALVNTKLGTEAEQAKTAAQRMLQEAAGLDPALIRLAEQNAKLANELNAIAARLDALDAEQAKAESLAGRIKTDYKREQAATDVSGLTVGLGQLLLQHRQSLPDLKVHAHKALALEQQIAAVNLSRLRHLDEAERIADLDRSVSELAAELTVAETPQLRDLVKQRQGLLNQQLVSEGRYMNRLRSLQASESRMLAPAQV